MEDQTGSVHVQTVCQRWFRSTGSLIVNKMRVHKKGDDRNLAPSSEGHEPILGSVMTRQDGCVCVCVYNMGRVSMKAYQETQALLYMISHPHLQMNAQAQHFQLLEQFSVVLRQTSDLKMAQRKLFFQKTIVIFHLHQVTFLQHVAGHLTKNKKKQFMVVSF